ncbi:MAG: MarR family winged helix-turn-helix transcriptional regulator [Fimbriimonadales bacterium]|nr:MarR family winged helix-turn-helix transcriptional regulator [Fimbriimonadales bacterium]
MSADAPVSLVAEAALFYEAVASRLEPRLKEAGLTMGTFELLSAVHAARGRAHQAELARRLGVTPPTLCEALRSAVRAGLVVQQDDPADARIKRVSLTEAGAAALARTLSELDELEREAVAELGEQAALELATGLRRAARRLIRA